MPTDPGDGKSNPFGNGAGVPGSGQASGRGNDFTRNPGGGSPTRKGGGQPSSYGQSIPAAKGTEQADINPNEIPPGGKTLFADNRPVAGENVGVGSVSGGGGGKPFKLGGGGF